MKKKIITAIIIVISLILFIPIPIYLKDGGTVEYNALLYKISDVHSLALAEDMENGEKYNEGIIIEIFGFEIYNSVQ